MPYITRKIVKHMKEKHLVQEKHATKEDASSNQGKKIRELPNTVDQGNDNGNGQINCGSLSKQPRTHSSNGSKKRLKSIDYVDSRLSVAEASATGAMGMNKGTSKKVDESDRGGEKKCQQVCTATHSGNVTKLEQTPSDSKNNISINNSHSGGGDRKASKKVNHNRENKKEKITDTISAAPAMAVVVGANDKNAPKSPNDENGP